MIRIAWLVPLEELWPPPLGRSLLGTLLRVVESCLALSPPPLLRAQQQQNLFTSSVLILIPAGTSQQRFTLRIRGEVDGGCALVPVLGA